jgi:hypothetical protein
MVFNIQNIFPLKIIPFVQLHVYFLKVINSQIFLIRKNTKSNLKKKFIYGRIRGNIPLFSNKVFLIFA